MYNATHVSEVRRLHAEGLNDYEIADISGIPRHTVRRIRIQEELPPVKRKDILHSALYEICDPITGDILFTGEAPKAAAFIGLDNISTFFTTVTRSRKGKYKRYIIRNVKGKERPKDE